MPSYWLGRKRSIEDPETMKKLWAGGQAFRASPEYAEWKKKNYAKLSKTLKDRKFSDEHRHKISVSKRGEKNARWKGGICQQRKTLIAKVRTLPEYNEWKREVLRRDVVSFPHVPKRTQVHHIVGLEYIVKENNIQTIEDALACKQLWDTDNGVAIMQGEHYIATLLNRFKTPSKGLLRYVKWFIEDCEKTGRVKAIGDVSLNEDRGKDV